MKKCLVLPKIVDALVPKVLNPRDEKAQTDKRIVAASDDDRGMEYLDKIISVKPSMVLKPLLISTI